MLMNNDISDLQHYSQFSASTASEKFHNLSSAKELHSWAKIENIEHPPTAEPFVTSQLNPRPATCQAKTTPIFHHLEIPHQFPALRLRAGNWVRFA